MAAGDKGGRRIKLSDEARGKIAEVGEEIAEQKDNESNLEVGDFITELATAIRYRDTYGLHEGEWVDEPERAYTDGHAFGEEERAPTDKRLQITLSIDASLSMWNMDRKGLYCMGAASHAFAEIDRVIRKAMTEFPEGAIVYSPFVFHATAHRLPAAYVTEFMPKMYKNRQGNYRYAPITGWPTVALLEKARVEGFDGPTSFCLYGEDTVLAKLFQAIADWETTAGDPTAKRLDLVITDGRFDEADVHAASEIQTVRNGDLTTILLNFLPPEQWEENLKVPERCIQYAVDTMNLTGRLRAIMTETINAL